MQTIIEKISEESGADRETVRRVATLLLRELHRVAATDDMVTTAAMMETRWNFGTEACYHLGGLLMYHDDCGNGSGQQTTSLVPETLRRFLGSSEELQEISQKWRSYLVTRRSDSE